MQTYCFNLIGVDEDETGADFESKAAARDAAVVCLGEYLRDYPAYANQGHWQVDVLDQDRELVLSVVVATVDAPPRADTSSRTRSTTTEMGNGYHRTTMA